MSSGDPSDRLAQLEAVTDLSLSRLDVEDLLTQLLGRVRDLLHADTAAVLLLDPTSQELQARATLGIEEEVRQGVRLPIGRGFAGTIAAERRPIAIDRVDETTVVNPILWRRGIRTMLGVPLLARDELLGVLHVGRLHDTPFSSADAELLEFVADRVSAAVQHRTLAVERAAASLLERSLMPARLPSLPGIEFAARYVASEERAVGGDWYDAFVLPSGELWVVTGDVAGHGLQAAAVMGRLRSALRSYALAGGPPETVLEWTDRKVQHFEVGSMATVVVACAQPPFEDFRISVAGHPAPVLAFPNGIAALVDVVVDPPLGTLPELSRTSVSVRVPSGALLLLYTDGLVERRGESLDDGLARLIAAVSPVEPELVCATVMQELVGSSIPRDDVALLAIRRL